jgi:hypothetical protein
MEWWQTTLTIFAGIITCLTLWDKIESRVKSEKQPTNELEAVVDIPMRIIQWQGMAEEEDPMQEEIPGVDIPVRDIPDMIW